MSKGKIKRAASTLKTLEGITFESCLDDGDYAIKANKWLIECSWEVANKGQSLYLYHPNPFTKSFKARDHRFDCLLYDNILNQFKYEHTLICIKAGILN